ncbi:hypothetical protein IEN85_05030 [Pelagicoccus sp. NFK12]|uniref:Peptidase M56 domain-containing protein n=1 Tax=Pelagicoccus enzymogenes TaxID=2773457 RepID=A0A927IGX7_9BACT|nr:M56 family metallopeptidase [Pelagicoccus enzymogenes]MBD5778845.1 hypothetical protein [Pelagicoccus enzymogenes]
MSEWSYYLLSHLWESSLFGIVCALLILALGRSWSFSRHFLAWASLLKLVVPFAVFASLFSWMKSSWPAGDKGEFVGFGYLDLTARTLKIDTWVDLGTETIQAQAVFPWELMIVIAWAAGFVALGIYWLRQHARVVESLRSSSLPAGREWQVLAERVWKRPIRRMPKILISQDSLLAAGVFGIFRPIVIIPATLNQALSVAEREAFLRHEFQHVYKRDTLWLFVQTFIRNLFWMHPLVWWLDRQISAEREILRDEEVIRKTENVTSYLNCLMKVSKIKLPSSYATSVGIMGAPFAKRIKSITRIGRSRVGDFASAVGSVVAVSALTILLSASMSLSEVKAATDEEKGEEAEVKLEPSLTDAEQALVKKVIADLKENGDKELALDRIYEAITEDSSAALEFIAANFHAEKGDVEKAIQFYQVAADKMPTFRRAIRNMGIMQVKLEDYEGGKESLLKVRELGAEDTTTLGLIGLCYVNTEDFVSAEHYYRLAIEKDSTVRDWKVGLAKALLKAEKYSKAEPLLVSLLEEAENEGDTRRAEILRASLENARLSMGK